MKRLLLLGLLLVLAGGFYPASGQSSSHVYLKGQTAVGRSLPYTNREASRVVSVHVWCDVSTTCSGNVDVEVANSADEPPYRAVRISNPDGTGEVWYTNGKIIYLNLSSTSSGTYWGTIQE